MCYFVSLAIEQGLAQIMEFSLRGQRTNLLLVVVVDKRLNCLDRCVDRLGAEQRWQGASQKPGNSPQWQQAAVMRWR